VGAVCGMWGHLDPVPFELDRGLNGSRDAAVPGCFRARYGSNGGEAGRGGGLGPDVVRHRLARNSPRSGGC